jgi:hypothetical protein
MASRWLAGACRLPTPSLGGGRGLQGRAVPSSIPTRLRTLATTTPTPTIAKPSQRKPSSSSSSSSSSTTTSKPPRQSHRPAALVNDTSTTKAALHQELPEGVTKDFLLAHRAATAALLAAQGTTTVSMEGMVAALRTAQDAELFVGLLERCRRAGIPPTTREPHVILNGLLAKGVQGVEGEGVMSVLLRILSNRPLFCCVPKRELLHAIMAHYYQRVVTLAGDAEGDEARLTGILDTLSKCYLLLLYHDIPPNAESYAYLIKAGRCAVCAMCSFGPV